MVWRLERVLKLWPRIQDVDHWPMRPIYCIAQWHGTFLLKPSQTTPIEFWTVFVPCKAQISLKTTLVVCTLVILSELLSQVTKLRQVWQGLFSDYITQSLLIVENICGVSENIEIQIMQKPTKRSLCLPLWAALWLVGLLALVFWLVVERD